MSYATPAVNHRFLHVAVNFRNGVAKTLEFDRLMNSATSWYRYAPNCWILWTNGTARSWHDHLAPHITTNDYLFIAELKANGYWGWMPQEAWEWMKEHSGNPG